MVELFTIENLFTLMVLTALETVLGFDNLLYISIEAKRVAPEQQKYVRRLGIILAIGLRIVLLFVVLQLISLFQSPWFGFDLPFVYLMWIAAIVILFPACQWFADLKRRRRDKWLSYL